MDDDQSALTPAEALEGARRRLLERDRLREERDGLMVRRALEPDNDSSLATTVREVTARLAEYASVEEDLAAAERRLEVERVRTEGGVHGQRLAEIERRLDVVRRKEQVLREVLERAHEVAEDLLRAEHRLGSAGTMGVVDTVVDGGLRPSIWVDRAKYTQVDEAVRLLRRAQSSLRLLSFSQGLEVYAALEGLDLSDLHRTFDVFLDNPLSDIRTFLKLRAAREQVSAVRSVVSGMVTRLNLDLLLAQQDLSALEQERESLA